MAKRDLIIAFFSQPNKATDPDRMVYKSGWKNEPFVYAVEDKYSCPGLSRPQGPRACTEPMNGVQCVNGYLDECTGGIRDFGFATAVREHTRLGNGSPLTYYTQQATKQSGGDTWGRIAVVTFSAGHSGARQLMAIDAEDIDTYISLDSLTLAQDANGRFLDYAEEGQGIGSYAPMGIGGFDASSMMILLHTDITTPGRSSTKASAEALFSDLRSHWNLMQQSLTNPAEGFGWLNPEYPWANLVDGPRKWWPRDAAHPNPRIADRIGNNFRIHLPTNVSNQTDGHRACGADFQRAIFDTFLKPRWDNPSLFSCIGSGCINPFTKDPPLSGFAGLGAVTAPTSKFVDMERMKARWDAAGLFRWDTFYQGLAVATGLTAAALLTKSLLDD